MQDQCIMKMEKYENDMMDNVVEPMFAEDIIIEIANISNASLRDKYMITRQILDDYNHVEYLVTRNNLKIPVNLYSGPVLGLFNVDYGEVEPLSYQDTMDMCNELSSITSIPVVPRLNVLDNKANVFGIIVNSSNFIETVENKFYDESVMNYIDNGRYKNIRKVDDALKNSEFLKDERTTA